MNRKKWTIGLLGLASILSLIAIACGRRNDGKAEDNGIGNTDSKSQTVYISESTIFCENASLLFFINQENVNGEKRVEAVYAKFYEEKLSIKKQNRES